MKRLMISMLASILIVSLVIAGAAVDAQIDAAKLSVKDAFYRAIRDGVKTEIGGVPLYTESSIGKSDISWRFRSLEAPPYRGQYPRGVEKGRTISDEQEALEYAWSICAEQNQINEYGKERLTTIVHLEKDNLWMFCYWLVGYDGGVSGYVIDGNSGKYLKGWVEE